ncbi:MAG TPA: hypothetical protein VGQ42_03560 [Candidatus Dormibacteraeota bacterium]|jgi:hypothetical protein|nr:hypothetical protein [Candidatus Dormibacteraeota bacterium]
MSAEMSVGLQSAFAALRQESSAPPRPAAMAVARAAMHQARVAPRRAGVAPLPLFADRLRRAFTPGRMTAAGGGLATGMAAVALLGWNAPAGSPLHVVRIAHEQIALAVPGADRIGLQLSYAESRLRDAVQGTATAASLDEAAQLLGDVHGGLPGDHSSALWSRWQVDQNQLDHLREQQRGEDGSGSPGGPGGRPEGTPGAAGAGAAGGDDGGRSTGAASPSPGGGDRGSSAPAPGGTPHDGRGGPSPQPSATPGDGGRGSTTTTTSSTTHSSDRGGSSTSSTSSTSSGSKGGPPPGDVATTTTTTTTTSSTSHH